MEEIAEVIGKSLGLFKLTWPLLGFGMLMVLKVTAQADTLSATAKADSATFSRQMDLCDLAELVIKKNLRASKEKKRKLGPFFTILPSPGYAIATGFTAALDGDLSFYTSAKYQGNLSFFDYGGQYSQYNQILTQALSSVFFNRDKLLLSGDWHFYNFPTYTYGLGSLTTPADQDRIDFNYFRFYETALYRIGPKTMAGIGYNLDYHWHIKDYDGLEGVTDDFQKYGYSNSSISSGPTFNLRYDSRDNTHEATSGTYLNLQFCMHARIFGSSSNWSSLITDIRQFIKIPTRYWKSVIALRGYIWLTPSGTAPYLDLPNTAGDPYNTLGRGYAQGRFTGVNMLYAEAEYRFSIMKNELIGGVIFANLQSFSQWPGGNFAAVQPGIGAGIRIKLNKYTSSNWAIDYGVGTGGSRGFVLGPNEAF